MRTILVIGLCIIGVHISCFSQEAANNESNRSSVVKLKDTININDMYRLVITLPSKGVKNKSVYQAGYFITYFIPADTALFSIYAGPLPEEAFVSGSECTVTDSLMVEEVFFERRGYCNKCGEKNTNRKGYFREKEFMLLMYSAKYEWVNIKKLPIYDKIFSNIEILTK